MFVIWEEIKNQIRSKLPEKSFSLWINPLTFLENKDDTLVLGCPNKFSRNWIMENYIEIIEEKLNSIGNGNYRLVLKVKALERRKPSPILVNGSKQLALPNIRKPNGSNNGCLNKDFTFDRFVVGSCNEFAYSASKAIALEGAQLYNPLFMLANTGLGKVTSLRR